MAIELDKDGIQIYQTDYEQENLCKLANEVKSISGSVIEVGVFMGGSAAIFASILDKPIYLFDTFEGLPESISIKDGDSEKYYVGHCKAEYEQVKERFKDKPNIKVIKGEFPNCAKSVDNERFALAHIDTDIYQATKESLEYIYPRMNKGGIIIVHDYPAHLGVKKAVDEFDKPLEVLGPRQAVIRKI